MTEAERIEMIAAALCRYLGVHPQAADTLEVVHRWWIDWGDEEEAPELTRRALRLLVEQGVMECVRIGDRQIWRGRRAL